MNAHKTDKNYRQKWFDLNEMFLIYSNAHTEKIPLCKKTLMAYFKYL